MRQRVQAKCKQAPGKAEPALMMSGRTEPGAGCKRRLGRPRRLPVEEKAWGSDYLKLPNPR
jgi:hypothetical protein